MEAVPPRERTKRHKVRMMIDKVWGVEVEQGEQRPEMPETCAPGQNGLAFSGAQSSEMMDKTLAGADFFKREER